MESLAKSNRVDHREDNRTLMNNYCTGLGHSGITDECLRQGKKSESKKIRKIASSAVSAKQWNKGK